MSSARTSKLDAGLLRLLTPRDILMRVPAALRCIVHLTYLPAGAVMSASLREHYPVRWQTAADRIGLQFTTCPSMSGQQRVRSRLPSACASLGVTLQLTVSDIWSRVSTTARGGSRWLTRLSLSPCTLQRALR